MDELDLARKHRNALRREQYRLDGGKRKAENQEWKEQHREQVREAGREYQRLLRSSPEGRKRYLANQKRSYAKHRDERLSATKKWHQENPGYSGRWHAKNKKKNPVLYMWRNSKNRAKRDGIEFSISQADIVVPELCPVLGIKLEFGHGKGTGFFSPSSPSVDRFDNSKGYTKENIRIISWRANMLKHDATVEEMRKVLAYMEQGKWIPCNILGMPVQ